MKLQVINYIVTRKSSRCFIIVAVILVCYVCLHGWKSDDKPILQPSVLSNFPKAKHSVEQYHVPPPTPSLLKKWLLFETSDHPEVCTRLAMNFPEWTIALVGVKSYSNYSHSRCRFIDKDDAKHFWEDHGYDSIHRIHITLLHIAYLLAVKNGADLIYAPRMKHIEDFSLPPIFTQHFKLELLHYKSQSDTFFDPNTHYGCNSTSHGEYDVTYYLCSSTTIPAIQSFAIVGPIQKIHSSRLSELVHQEHIKYCDSSAPPIVISRDSFAPLLLRDSIFHSNAFWAFPSIHFNSTLDAFHWSFIVQRLLWFISTDNQPSVSMSFHTLQDSLPADIAMISLKLRQFLLSFQCNEDSFLKCALLCVKELLRHQFVNHMEADAFTAWMKILATLGYTFPPLSTSYTQHCSSHVVFRPVNHRSELRLKSYSTKPLSPVNNLQFIQLLYQNTCTGNKKYRSNAPVEFASPWIQFEQILLLVIFNKAHYESLPYIELIYRSMFPHILYCGPGYPDLEMFPHLRELFFSFIPYHPTPKGHADGSFNYECSSKAMKMQYKVKGILVIADDLLLTIHPLRERADFTDSVWFLPKKEVRIGEITKLRECRLGMCDFYPHWNWWEEYQAQILNLFKTFKHRDTESSLIHQCYKQLKDVNGADMRPCGGYSDIYYIPQRLSEQFSELSDVFLSHDIFLEIAVPTIIWCLEPPEEVQPLKGKQLWELDRTSPWKYFTPKDLLGMNYLHPTKWSGLPVGDNASTNFLCNNVLPFLHDPYARFTDV